MLEPAIPEHLRQERALPVNLPAPDFQPAYPSYSARFPKSAKDLVLAIFGSQYACRDDDDGAATANITSLLNADAVERESRPSFFEPAAVTDNRGFYNVAVLAYWPTKDAYTQWASASGFQAWWDGLDPEEQQHGRFLEVFFPAVGRFETVFSNHEIPEGAAHMRESVSGMIQEHAYWGSMRDRMPLSQTDPLRGEPANLSAQDLGAAPAKLQRRVRVPGKKNLCVIRSGQDWSSTGPEEREIYLTSLHPTLIRGMDFLRDHGEEMGCYSCRFMEIVDPATREADKDRTFGLAYFDDMKSLELWCREHPTHLDIFGGFFRYAKTLNNSFSLRVFHEVLVLEPEQQLFEYIACHEGTGMLRSVVSAS
ncbi:heme-containing dehydratase protein [Xylariomycetidae sp. FL2044]|nr:heme-containing dehydratase protein [Xylariomycetidae sp. FL2044]